MEPAIQTQESPAYRTIGVEPLTPSIGAEISGFKMSGDLPEEQIAEIRAALLEWKVIFFRDQDVEVAEHVAFGRRFGVVREVRLMRKVLLLLRQLFLSLLLLLFSFPHLSSVLLVFSAIRSTEVP